MTTWTADTDKLVATVQIAIRAESNAQLSSTYWELIAIERGYSMMMTMIEHGVTAIQHVNQRPHTATEREELKKLVTKDPMDEDIPSPAPR